MARRHRRGRGIAYSPLRPGWIGSGVCKGKIVLSNEDLAFLLRFYVLETPCEKVSYASKPLEDRGWGPKPWRTKGNRLRQRLLEDRGFVTNDTVFIGTAVAETRALFNDASMNDDFRRTCRSERIAFYDCDKVQFLSIARHIRNSLAHGRFAASIRDGETWLYLEDGKPSNDRFAVRARMVLKLSTLREWKRILSRESELERFGHERPFVTV